MERRYAVFESFAYDRLRNALTCGGRPSRSRPRRSSCSRLFLERPGELLTEDAILELLWPGEFVQEGNLSQQVYLLRKTLASFGSGNLILTVPRRGYRFAAEVRMLDAPPVQAGRSARGNAHAQAFSFAGGWRARSPLRVALAAVLVAVTATGVDLAYRAASQRSVAHSAIASLPPDAQRAYRLTP